MEDRKIERIPRAAENPMSHPILRFVKVYLDGVHIKYVTSYDVDKGIVVHFDESFSPDSGVTISKGLVRVILDPDYSDVVEFESVETPREVVDQIRIEKALTKEGEGWMETWTGVKFRIPHLHGLNSIDIRDVAHSLSMICRYNGHCRKFYSVAEHCVLMTDWYVKEYCSHGYDNDTDIYYNLRMMLTVLLHDSAEAYMGDMIQPLKRYFPSFKTMESEIERTVSEQYGTYYPTPPIVKIMDSRIIADERSQVMRSSGNEWIHDEVEPLGVTVKFWSPTEAEREFMKVFKEISNNLDRRRERATKS